MNHQGKRIEDYTSVQVEPKKNITRSNELLAKQVGESVAQIKRYIRLTNLIPKIMDMVDKGIIAFTPAVELSYLTEEEQYELHAVMDMEQCTPSLSQATEMKVLSRQGKLDMDAVFSILEREKPNQREQIKIRADMLDRYFPDNYTPQQKVEIIELVGEIKQINSLHMQQIGTAIEEEKVQHDVGEMAFPIAFSYVPWGHHILIITKCETIEEALFYIKRTIAEGLSRNALDNCIRADMYHVIGMAATNFREQLPDSQGKLAQELIKENYDLSFISLPEEYDEIALEDAIEQRMTRFLLELGEGWAFVGRQKEIIISGKTRKIDV